MDLDDFLLGPGGNRKPGARFKVDDFLLEVPISTDPAADPQGFNRPPPLIPQAGTQAPGPQDLLNPDSILPDPLQAGMIAAGETASKALTGFTDPRVQEMVNEARPSTEALREEFPTATMLGDVVPTMAVPGGGIIGGAASGALIADDPVTGALFGAGGGVLGALSSRFLMRTITPFPRQVGQGLGRTLPRDVRSIARRLGVNLEVADVVQSKGLKNAGTAIRRNPFASKALDKLDTQRSRAFNKAALRSIGVKKGDRITDEILENTRVKVSAGFERIGAKARRISASQQWQDKLSDFIREAEKTSDPASMHILRENINDVRLLLSGDADGRALASLSSTLGKRADTLSKPGSASTAAGSHLYTLKHLTDDLLFENLPAKAKGELTDLRRLWANLRTLRDRNVVVAESVNPGALRARLQSTHPDEFRLGKREDNELFMMSRLHERVRELIPNSGTPTGQAFDPGNVMTTPIQRIQAAIMADPVFRFYARNNLLPDALQEIIERGASRAGTVGAVDALNP